MKLVFYSGGLPQENILVDKAMATLLPKKELQFTLIPPSFSDLDAQFNSFVRQYRRLPVHNFINLPVDLNLNQVIVEEAFRSDLIHLGGGNTFHFLKNLRQKKMLPLLQKFVDRGGILTGLSAGAILMTPNIQMASIPDFDRDENFDNLKNLAALNLVKFEVFPHYKNSQRYDHCFREYTRHSPRPLYALPDGAGIMIHDESIQFIGKIFVFFKGRKMRLS